MTEIAIHFGVYRDREDSLHVLGYTSPGVEHQIPLYTSIGNPVEAYVSGSWACWGPADQDTDGDDSLHVLVLTDQPWAHEFARALYETLCNVSSGDVLPYAWVTTQMDWAETLSIATFAGGHTCLAAVTGPSAMVVHA